MARLRPVQVFKDGPLDIEAKIIKAIGSVGPRNVALISRITGAHQETVRYKIKKRFAKLGFRYHADVDYSKLGLEEYWATLRFVPRFADLAKEVLWGLSECGYLTYFAKVVPQGHYVALFVPPAGKTRHCRALLKALEQKGILSEFAFERVAVSRHSTMNPRFFNFDSGQWEVEWEKVKGEAGRNLTIGGSIVPAMIDEYDLLLIKELQKDALEHVVALARKLKVRDRTLEYHYRVHVQKQKLIPSYRVRWTQDIEKRLRHSVVTTRLVFKGLDSNEFAKVQTVVSKIPFLWAEDLLQNRTYVATLYVPTEDMLGMQAYLSDELPGLGSRIQTGFVKPDEAFFFTVPYDLFKDGKWKFDVQAASAAIDQRLSNPGKK